MRSDLRCSGVSQRAAAANAAAANAARPGAARQMVVAAVWWALVSESGGIIRSDNAEPIASTGAETPR